MDKRFQLDLTEEQACVIHALIMLGMSATMDDPGIKMQAAKIKQFNWFTPSALSAMIPIFEALPVAPKVSHEPT